MEKSKDKIRLIPRAFSTRGFRDWSIEGLNRRLSHLQNENSTLQETSNSVGKLARIFVPATLGAAVLLQSGIIAAEAVAMIAMSTLGSRNMKAQIDSHSAEAKGIRKSLKLASQRGYFLQPE